MFADICVKFSTRRRENYCGIKSILYPRFIQLVLERQFRRSVL